VKLQQWVVHEGLRVVIVFEGRDAAGKGGTIKRIVDLNCITHLLSLIPYKELPTEAVKLGKRQSPNGYKEPVRAYHLVPEVY